MRRVRPFYARAKRAFTLVEVVVVIAVVALLSAIIVPLVAKQIDDAKIGRAKNDCVVIAAAVLQFYRDVGVWPSGYGNNGSGVVINYVYSLVSGTALDSDAPGGTATQYGFAANGNDDWYDGGSSQNKTMDVFNNQLNVNLPWGGPDTYATTGEFRWRGPYLAPVGMDPWGHPYMCNIRAAYSGTNTMCVVMSAGPNGTIDTSYTAARYGLAATSTDPTGDDIWAIVATRP